MQKPKIKFTKFYRAFLTLEAIYLKPTTTDRMNIDATIQRFEFTFELAWKFLKDHFYEKGVSLNFPKEIFKEAFAAGLIDSEELWLNMLYDRNMTSHTYDEKIADEIYARIKNYVPELKILTQKLKREYL
jgi:nucleotidyltransferase substrate binding protein (TIGR01987 family)